MIIARLARAGARAVFGMPGGGTNLDLVEAARRRGLPFVLTHTETAGALMAAAQAEMTGAPGVCLSTLGPGVASIVNGVAHAWLDRVPLVVLTDAMPPAARRSFEHQNLPHSSLLGPITRFTGELPTDAPDAFLTEAMARATGLPPGPVHIDCVPAAMDREVEANEPAHPPGGTGQPRAALPPAAARLLRSARRPLAIVGLGARRPGDAAAVRGLCARRALPVLVTYKAKGVIADDHPAYAGLFTLGDVERSFVERADALLTIGLDPVGLLPRPWPWQQPVVHCARWSASSDQMPPGETVVGDLAGILEEIDTCLPVDSEWTTEAVAAHRACERAAVMGGSGGFTPGRAAAVVARASSGARYVTVDAGAHMFPAMSLDTRAHPRPDSISNGLSTMGYALPAAIGAAMLAPREAVLAITGDAGLLLCLGELRTAAREGLRVVVVCSRTANSASSASSRIDGG